MTELRPINPEPSEQALMEVLAVIVRQLATHRQLRGSPHGQAPLAVKGGTGLVMGLGLTRPSTDLDIDVSKRSLTPSALADAVREIVGELPDVNLERCDVKQHGRGYMRLWFRKEGLDARVETKIDMLVCDGGRAHPQWEARPNGIDPNSVNWVGGAPIYKKNVLIAKKLNTLIGERTRQQARDLYDAAWILCHRATIRNASPSKACAVFMLTPTSMCPPKSPDGRNYSRRTPSCPEPTLRKLGRFWPNAWMHCFASAQFPPRHRCPPWTMATGP